MGKPSFLVHLCKKLEYIIFWNLTLFRDHPNGHTDRQKDRHTHKQTEDIWDDWETDIIIVSFHSALFLKKKTVSNSEQMIQTSFFIRDFTRNWGRHLFVQMRQADIYKNSSRHALIPFLSHVIFFFLRLNKKIAFKALARISHEADFVCRSVEPWIDRSWVREIVLERWGHRRVCVLTGNNKQILLLCCLSLSLSAGP